MITKPLPREQIIIAIYILAIGGSTLFLLAFQQMITSYVMGGEDILARQCNLCLALVGTMYLEGRIGILNEIDPDYREWF